MAKIKPYVSDRFLFDVAEKRFGIHLDEDDLVFDDDAIAAAVALGPPKRFPQMLEDPVECKKAYINYIKQMHGFFLTSYTGTGAPGNAHIKSSSEAIHSIPSSSAEQGPKTGALPSDSTL